MSEAELRKEIRKVLRTKLLKFDEWSGTPRKHQVIVTYDIIDKGFRKSVRTLIKEEFGGQLLSESTYLLRDRLTTNQVKKLMNKIVGEYEILLESKQANTKSIIRIILPDGDDFKGFALRFPRLKSK